MRWPFRTKHHESSSEYTDSGDSGAPVYAASMPRNEWANLPPAPIAIAVRAPRTIVGNTSAIRRPIGIRELRDVTDDAAIGIVEGIVGIAPAAAPAPTRPEAPIGQPSALPEVVVRTVRRVDGASVGALTTSESVVVVASPPSVPPPSSPERGRPAVRDGDDDGAELRHAPRQSLAQSRRLGLGPGYHGSLPDAILRDRLDRGASDEEHVNDGDDDDDATERVPDDLRTIIRDAYGHDVGDQLVQRGADASDEARRLGAHAFTRDGEVFVPREAGPLDGAHAKSLLAHELTHLVQQRRRNAPLPADGSPEADALEAEAQRAERFVRGDPGAPAPGAIAASGTGDASGADFGETQRFVDELVHRGVAEPDGTGGIRFLWGHGGGGRVQRATEPAGPATREENWGIGASVAHALGETFVGELEDMFVGEFSFVTGVEDEVKKAHEEREREYRRFQTKEAFGRLRLEHLRVQKRKEIGADELTDTQERELERAVEAEVIRRTDALEFRVKRHLEEVNEQLKLANKDPQPELDPDRYDAIFNRLFAQPDGDLPDDEPHADVKAHAEQVANKAKANAAKSAMPPGAPGGPPPGGGTGTPSPRAGAPTDQAGAPGGTTGGSGGIDSFSALGRALVTDFAVLDAGEFGVTLTDDELKGMFASGTTAPAKAADKAAPTPTTPPKTPTPGPGGPGDAKHIGPSGHEKIDLDRIDFEELSKRLFPRLRSSLRQELLVDRERSGRLNH